MKIILCILLLLLSGCYNDNFKELGYDNTEIKKIRSLSKDNQVFFSEECNDFLKTLITSDDFNEENLETYLIYEGILENDVVINLVNEGIVSKSNYGTVKLLACSKNFVLDNIETYLKYPSDNPRMVIETINSNNEDKIDYIRQLSKDPMFIEDNIELYVRYKNASTTNRGVIELVNTKRYIDFYDEIFDADTKKYGYQVLVNKYYNITNDYEPDDLVSVEAEYGIGKLRSEAYDAYKIMQDAAKEEGLNFYITSPYRSYYTQEKLYNNYLATDTRENVDIYSARPGSSEHQLGLAVDILKPGTDFGNFYETEEAKWLADNAYKYGFILRYPEDKVYITGYKYEPWHYRYVGDIAEDVYRSGVSFDEYFEKYINEDNK